MSTKSDSPQIVFLKQEVEKQFGRPVRTTSDFVLVADRIESRTHEHISDSTIKRIWKPALAYDTISERSLNVIAACVGFPHFKAFCDNLATKGLVESELICSSECIKELDLSIGDIVELGWLPDRECDIKYLGGHKFEVIRSSNSTIQPGDIFACTAFFLGRRLYVDDLHHGGKIYDSYGMGLEHGLTRVRLKSRAAEQNETACMGRMNQVSETD